MNHPVYDTTGKKISTQKLPVELFAVKVNSKLISQYIRVYLSRQRQGTKKTKSRGEIAISTAKIWRQKGTGRARHGARSAPIFVGGGVAHGPTGQENYQLTISKRMRRLALLGALTIKSETISIITGLEKIKPKTKIVQNLINQISSSAKTLLILDQPNSSLIKAASNIETITVTQAKRLNAYEVLNHHHLIFTKESLKQLSDLHQPKKLPQTSTTSVKVASQTQK